MTEARDDSDRDWTVWSIKSLGYVMIAGSAFGLCAAIVIAYLSLAHAGERGLASIYDESSGTQIACPGMGMLDVSALTAAHKTLRCGSRVRVRGDNGRSVVVTINDRGPFIDGRVIDLTPAAAAAIGLTYMRGLMRVEIEIVER